MKEYICKEDIRNKLYDADAITMRGVAIINDFPAADVLPVVRGKWIDGACSNCGFFTDIVMSRFFSYCPNCGADMREEQT